MTAYARGVTGSADASLGSACESRLMIDRYTLPEMGQLFSAPAKFERWLEVELAAVDGWAHLGRVPSEAASRIRASAPQVDAEFVSAVEQREIVTRHDVAAFVDVVAAVVGDEGRWIHYGLAASDVVDTALGIVLGRASDLIVEAARGLFDALASQARRHRTTVMIGRTHGVHAEPISLGAKFALLALQVSRAAQGVAEAGDAARVGKLSGAVGTYAHVEPAVEEYVCRVLALRPIAASQVVPRDLIAGLMFALARAASVVEATAVQVRLGHQSEVREISEGFGEDQKGSSSMPHKANPITSEQLCGLARLARGSVVPALESLALWHERDLTHSSVERVILTDTFSIVHYALRTAASMVASLVIDEGRIAENLVLAGDLVCSQSLLLRLIDDGRSREEAYQVAQEASRAAIANRTSLQAAARKLGVPDVVLAAAFDVAPLLVHADRAVAELDRCWPDRDP